MQVRLETGRRNQIRVHFAEAGHPVLGDARYQPELAAHPHWPHKRPRAARPAAGLRASRHRPAAAVRGGTAGGDGAVCHAWRGENRKQNTTERDETEQ